MEEEKAQAVLVVDDDPQSRKLAANILEREGYRVLLAPNGEEALLLAKVENPGLILLDIMMPKMDGHKTMRRLKEDLDTKDIPIVMVTGRGGDRDIANSYKYGAAGYVEKPYEIQELLQKVRMVCSMPSPDGE